MAEYEECFCCNRKVRTDKRHWRVHMTTSNEIVGQEYQGEDSQGTFAIGANCRKRYPEAFIEDET
jgi:hypothetical protein